MIFKVTRTSLFDEKEEPCPQCRKEQVIDVDERTVDHPSKLLGDGVVDWFQRGENHRIENGHIRRDFDGVGWFIEISSLDQLLDFIKKNKEEIVMSVLDPPASNGAVAELEIYDKYRE